MPEFLHLEILTPEKKVFEVKEATRINLLLADGGRIGIQPHHAPLLAETAAGLLLYTDDNGENSLEVEAGVLHISQEKVVLLVTDDADQPVSSTELEPDRAQFDRLLKALFNALKENQTGAGERNESQ